jgi:serine/threonine-protein kinase mTOR
VLKGSSLSESFVGDTAMGDDLTTRIARQHAKEMAYSVIYATETGPNRATNVVDLTAKEELWLAKLGSWTEALAIYEEKLKRDPHDYEAMLGCMRCFVACGEWQKLLGLVEQNWPSLTDPDGGNDDAERRVSARSQRKALRMCAQASWRLEQWDDLDAYSAQLVSGLEEAPASQAAVVSGSRDSAFERIDFDGAFYSAVLHVHRKEWTSAADSIDAARKAMDGRLTALMAESYNRAYPSMVTAQALAEMEEIIEFRRTEERFQTRVEQHPVNRPDCELARQKLFSVWRDRLAGCRVDAEVHSSILSVRSLVLGPADDVEATLTLSDLFCQAQRQKYAERVLLDPLEAMNADLDGQRFGLNLPPLLQSRGLVFETGGSPAVSVTERILLHDPKLFLPSYGADHERWTKMVAAESGGIEK